MKHPRYIAVLGRRDPFAARLILEERAAATGLALVHKSDGLSVFSDRPAALSLRGDAGAVLGAIRRNAPGMPDFSPTDAEADAILASHGDFLIESCWGDYVAFLAPPEAETIVLRAPFSDLACVHAAFEGLQIAASHPALIAQCTWRASKPHWDMIANHLFTVGLRQPQTCLAGIEELLWGAKLIAAPTGARIEPCWSPWYFAAKRERAAPADLAAMLRQVAVETVGASVRSVGHVAVMLSGGLDSSILAACIAASGTRLTCVNLTSGDAAGDERLYASLVAQTLGVPLHDAAHRLGDVDITRSEAAHLARPVARSFAQATRAAKVRMARAAGAEAILDGGGGDNVFCSLQSASPVADRLRRGGLGPAALGTAADVAMLTETGLFKVIVLGIRRAWRAPHYRWETDARFLTPMALERAGPPSHAWLQTPPGALPGSAAHIALMAIVEGLLETADDALPERAPLMNQPLVELCLSIPSWMWFEDGHNRVVARQAFAADLPDEIAWRRSKGTPDGFVARLFEASRADLRDLLCEGRLAAEGLLDRDAVAGTIARPGPVRGHDHIRLLRIADVEAWVCGL